MKARASLAELSSPLQRAGLEEVEVYLKSGRSRRFESGPQGRVELLSEERGWAVRAGGRRSSLFAAGTGSPRPGFPWPAPDGGPIHLPPPQAGAAWTADPSFEAPLLVESEAIGLLESFERALREELPDALLLRGVLEDGASESELASSRGLEASWRSRAAFLYLEAALPGVEAVRVSGRFAEREGRRFPIAGLARRFADRLLVRRDGRPVQRDRGEMVLAPEVGAAILAGLVPALVGPGAAETARHLAGRSGRLGSPAVSVVDDGRFPGGALEAPVDGEGVPTREWPLIEEGVFVRPLVSWREAGLGARVPGCSRRASWRELPRVGPTHLYLRPDRKVSAAALVTSVARGYYLLDVLGPGIFDLEGDRFELPVCGFALRRGEAIEPVSGSRLCGGIGALLRGIQAVARDLMLLPQGGLLGAPSLLVTGLELRTA